MRLRPRPRCLVKAWYLRPKSSFSVLPGEAEEADQLGSEVPELALTASFGRWGGGFALRLSNPSDMRLQFKGVSYNP